MHRHLFVAVLTLALAGSAAAQQAAPDMSAATASAPAPAAPSAIAYKGVTITPVGFLEGAMIYRAHNENADMPSTWSGVPLDGAANSKLSEFRGSARQSRFGLLVQGKLPDFDASGYYEMDFLGAAPTANENQTNSFNPRIRQLWSRLVTPGGFSLVAGQSWSLLTTNKSGLEPRKELLPATIEAQYVVGFSFARQLTLRATQQFGSSAWVAVSLENPETVYSAVNGPKDLLGLSSSGNAAAGNALANATSTDLAPDILAKIVLEPGFGHWELKGITRFFRDRYVPTADVTKAASKTTIGYGIGAAGVLSIVPDVVDFNIAGLFGKGIGRYGAAGGPDVTAKVDGSLAAVQGLQLLAGLETHPTKALDVYVYAGYEQYSKTVEHDAAANKDVGFGVATADLTGCSLETPSAAQLCQSSNHKIWQVAPGFWYRLHKGPEGTFQVGAQYSYTKRELWAGQQTVAATTSAVTPSGAESIGLLSVRYYIP